MGEHRHLDLKGPTAPFNVTPQIVDLRGKLPQNGEYSRRPIEGIRYIVIHHSATDVDSSAKDIALYHIGSQGWPGIGYHFVIRYDGAIEQAWDLDVMSYNVAQRNHEIVGICLPGNYLAKPPRKAQLASAVALVRWLLAGPLPLREVVGHGEIALPGFGTSCPGTAAEAVRAAL